MHHHITVRDLESVIKGHEEEKAAVLDAVQAGMHPIPSKLLRRDDGCAFGQWIREAPESLADYHRIAIPQLRKLHHDFHFTASCVVASIESRNTALALSLINGEFRAQSDMFIEALHDWRIETKIHTGCFDSFPVTEMG